MCILKCPSCGESFLLPSCGKCGFLVDKRNGIWLLTDAPSMVAGGDGDKYLGYEHIGENYSGKGLYETKDSFGYTHLVEEAVKAAEGGTILDLGCGDGIITVPLAEQGAKIIAVDISEKMMSTAHKRAEFRGVSLENVTFCRMNALTLDIADESVNVVICNSVLHLISNPEKVIQEIYRVLKKGGRFITIADMPGSSNSAKLYENKQYNKVINVLYNRYWEYLNERGVYAKKLSWKYDRDEICLSVFGKNAKEEKTIHREAEHIEKAEDYQLPRFKSRGFSDQSAVPPELHDKAFEYAINEIIKECGDNYSQAEMRWAEGDLSIISYTK